MAGWQGREWPRQASGAPRDDDGQEVVPQWFDEGLGKALSMVLRHRAAECKVKVRPDGFAMFEQVVWAVHRERHAEEVLELVERSRGGYGPRFEMAEGLDGQPGTFWIRAKGQHTMRHVVQSLVDQPPPRVQPGAVEAASWNACRRAREAMRLQAAEAPGGGFDRGAPGPEAAPGQRAARPVRRALGRGTARFGFDGGSLYDFPCLAFEKGAHLVHVQHEEEGNGWAYGQLLSVAGQELRSGWFPLGFMQPEDGQEPAGPSGDAAGPAVGLP